MLRRNDAGRPPEGHGRITAPSSYAAFGSKEELFREAVELYKKTQGARIVKALLEGHATRASFEAMLRAAADNVCGQCNPRGCLMVLGGINCALLIRGSRTSRVGNVQLGRK
jgi:AcrR family transcriptional regulator